MKRIFISHSSRDAEIAMRVCNVLENEGIMCWIAPRDISYGEYWSAEIATELLERTGLFVFLLSENSNKYPRQVIQEVNIAVNNNIPLVVFNIDNTSEMNRAFIYYFSAINICTCNPEDVVRNIVQVIERKINGQAGGREDQEKEAEQCSPNNKRIIRINITKELDTKFANTSELYKNKRIQEPQKNFGR